MVTLLDDHEHADPAPRRHVDPLLANAENRRVVTAEQPVVERRLVGADADGEPLGTGTGALIASVVVPGMGTWRRHRILAATLGLFGVVIPLALAGWVYEGRDRIVSMAFDRTFLLAIMVVGVLAVLARVVAIGEVAVAHRRTPGMALRTVAALIVTAVLSIPVVSLVSDAAAARDAVSDVFGSESGEPLFVPETGSQSPSAIRNVLATTCTLCGM